MGQVLWPFWADIEIKAKKLMQTLGTQGRVKVRHDDDHLFVVIFMEGGSHHEMKARRIKNLIMSSFKGRISITMKARGEVKNG